MCESGGRWWRRVTMGTIGTLILIWAGCHGPADGPGWEPPVSAYRDRMLVQAAEPAESSRPRGTAATPVAGQPELPPREALLAQPPVTTQPAPEEVLAEIPDPVEAPRVLEERLRRLREGSRTDARVVRNYERVVAQAMEELKKIHKPTQARLGLAECMQRALEHNYGIRYESYNPAISQAQLIQAEAAFDAEFFLEPSWDGRDPASLPEQQPSQTDTVTTPGGFRKLLPTGMRASVALRQQRFSRNYQEKGAALLNPAYDSAFVVALTQPLLRDFGLEVNRARVNIRKAERDIAHEKFVQTVIERLLDVERAYWSLAQARRGGAILAEQVAQNYVTYQNMEERKHHDATEVELAAARNRWLQRSVEYQEAVKNIRDAEDQFKNLVNDPEFLLSGEIEIVPTETPYVGPLALDQLAAARTALERRPEIRQARRAIDAARIGTMAAKNQTLPQFDLTFQYEVTGLGGSADSSFDNLTTNRFISYSVRAIFSYPLGNRARVAAHREARLRESQTIVRLHQVTDAVVQEVNAAVRALMVRYAQVPPQLDAVRTAESGLRALQARTQRIDPPYLDSELSAIERLAGARRALLGVVVDYNVSIVAMEKAKGTLLDYNNVVVTDEPPER